MLVIECALVGQAEAPGAALSQSYAKTRFQRRKSAADLRRRSAERQGAGRNAARLQSEACRNVGPADLPALAQRGPINPRDATLSSSESG
jgi:hypothetical protein